MTNEQRRLLEADGWNIDCESPFELSDADGARATGRAADIMLMMLERDGPDDENAVCKPDEELEVFQVFCKMSPVGTFRTRAAAEKDIEQILTRYPTSGDSSMYSVRRYTMMG